MTNINLLPEILYDIRKSLAAEAYLAALTLALTVPDICGRAEYGAIGSRKRYIDWYDEWIGQYEKPPEEEDAYLNGEVIYQLRCSVLHQGTPNIDNKRISEKRCKIDYFRIIIEPANQFEIYADSSETWSECHDKEVVTTVWYDVNLRKLCNHIIYAAEAYLRENKEKFNFFDYTILEYEFGENDG